MDNTLNQKILGCFNTHFDTWDGDVEAASKAIEVLILNEKIELLNSLYVNKMDGQENLYDARENKIAELTHKLTELNK